jgi:hypothetical protein
MKAERGAAAVIAGILSINLLPSASQAQTITLGENRNLGALDNDNAGLLLSQGPYALTQPGTIQSISFYVVNASGQLRLGIYDSGPNHNCKGGSLEAQTNPFSTASNSWNTANVINPVQLPVGSYCLAYEPTSNNLSFRKGISTGQSTTWYNKSFGSLPSRFSSSPNTAPNHWMFYATLQGQAATLSISFNPPNPTVPDNAPPGIVVAQAVATWSNGAPFTGTMSFQSPYFGDGGMFAFDASGDVIVNPNGPGLNSDSNTSQNVSIAATQ